MKIRIVAPEGKRVMHIPTELLYSEVICDVKKQSKYTIVDEPEEDNAEVSA